MTRDCGGRVWLNRSRSWENFGAELKKGGRNAEDVWVLSAPHEAGEVRFQFFAHKFCCFSIVVVSVACCSLQTTRPLIKYFYESDLHQRLIVVVLTVQLPVV